ncbi:MAG: SGNH/GDSL hydrolase family protein [Verrucomicrobia bacterium]|nr:SGNH/GDSL hydrolase family protein [Verrucomicrobiota bacterium]
MNPHSPNRSALDRRAFLKTSAVLLGTAGLGGLSQGCKTRPAGAGGGAWRGGMSPNDVVLFQGDSITDAGRSRDKAGEANHQAALGSGYAWLAAAALLLDRPNDGLKVYNRGISGNKVYQLAERWQQDCLDLKPNLVSILIGVNDLWHRLNGKYDGTVDVYEKDYRALIERTRRGLPGVKLVVCEPFVLRCGAVNEKWFPAFDGYRAAARRVADEFGAVFVPFQGMFDEAVKLAPPQHWAGDGVHPTAFGAALMARQWLKSAG